MILLLEIVRCPLCPGLPVTDLPLEPTVGTYRWDLPLGPTAGTYHWDLTLGAAEETYR